MTFCDFVTGCAESAGTLEGTEGERDRAAANTWLALTVRHRDQCVVALISTVSITPAHGHSAARCHFSPLMPGHQHLAVPF